MARKQLDESQSAEVTDEVPFTEHDAPVEAVQPALELVTSPGPKKVIRFAGDGNQGNAASIPAPAAAPAAQSGGVDWDTPASSANAANRPEGLQDIHAGVDRLGPDPRFAGRPRRANLAPVSIRSRTVYTTDRGGEVRSYESTTSSARTLTLTSPDAQSEVPFHSSMVDNVVGNEAGGNGASTAQGSTAEGAGRMDETSSNGEGKDNGTATTSKEARPRRRFGFFGRRAPQPEFHEDGQGDPNVNHVYQAAQVVESLPEAQPAPAAAPAAASGSGWEPGNRPGAQEVVFTEHEAPAAESTSIVEELAPQTWQAPKRRPRKGSARRKPATRSRRAARSRRPKTLLAYPGDNHPVIDIEGIGPKYAKLLEKAGITTTSQLAVAQAARVARKVGAPTKTVRGWQAQAELLKVKGVGPQFAEAMARAGIDGIDGLKARSANAIASQVTSYLDSLDVNVVGQSVTPKRVTKWQRAAAKLRKSRTTPERLATADHGIPPPWLRKGSSKQASKSGRAAKPSRPARGRNAAKGRKGRSR